MRSVRPVGFAGWTRGRNAAQTAMMACAATLPETSSGLADFVTLIQDQAIPGHVTLWILLKFLPPGKGRKKSFQKDPKGSFSHWTKGHLDYQGFEYVWTYFSWRVGRMILTQSALLDTHHGPLLTSQSQSQFEAQSILIGFGIQCRTCIQAPLGELRPMKRSLISMS